MATHDNPRLGDRWPRPGFLASPWLARHFGRGIDPLGKKVEGCRLLVDVLVGRCWARISLPGFGAVGWHVRSKMVLFSFCWMAGHDVIHLGANVPSNGTKTWE